MHYFITGATGFIGSRIASKLSGGGHRVTALVRDPRKAGFLTHPALRLVRGDITDYQSLAGAMDGCDGLFHLAAWYKVGARDKSPAVRINVDGTRNVLKAMEETGVSRGVYTSTIAVYSDTDGKLVDESYRFTGPHLSEYDRTKWIAHYEIARPMIDRGLPLTIVMPGLVYGPGDTSAMGRVLGKYMKKDLPFIPAKTAYCWSHVDDTAEGHILAMDKGAPGEEYILAGEPSTLAAALETAEEITGIPAPSIRIPPLAMKLSWRAVRAVETVYHPPPPYDSESLRVAAGVTYLADNTKARTRLGYRVRPLREGLESTLKAFENRGNRSA